MKALEVFTKLSIIAACMAVIVTCSTAVWWMEQDANYTDLLYSLEHGKLKARVAAWEQKVRLEEKAAQEAENVNKQ